MANDVTFRFGADSSGVKKELNSVKSAAANAGKSIAGALGVGLSVAGMASYTKNLIDFNDQIGKSAKRIGVTSEEFQKLAFASRRSGSTTENVERAFKRMQSTIYDATQGIKAADDALKSIGLSANDLKGKSPEKQFAIISEALNRVTDSTTKAALAQDIFGRAGTDLLPMISEYAELAKEAQDKGLIITNENIKAAEEFKDSMENLDSAIKKLVNQSGLISWLNDVAKSIDDIGKAKKAIESEKEKGGKVSGAYADKWYNVASTTMDAIENLNPVILAAKQLGYGKSSSDAMETVAGKEMLSIAAPNKERVKALHDEKVKKEADAKALEEQRKKTQMENAKKSFDSLKEGFGGFGKHIFNSVKNVLKSDGTEEKKEKKKKDLSLKGLDAMPASNALERIGANFGATPSSKIQEQISILKKIDKHIQDGNRTEGLR